MSDTVTLVAAILHDNIEDTQTTHAELVKEFGEAVADLVHEVNDDKTLEKTARKAMQVEKAHRLSPRAKLVKLADKTCNLHDILGAPPKGWSDQRKDESFRWAEDMVAAVGRLESLMLDVFLRARAARG